MFEKVNYPHYVIKTKDTEFDSSCVPHLYSFLLYISDKKFESLKVIGMFHYAHLLISDYIGRQTSGSNVNIRVVKTWASNSDTKYGSFYVVEQESPRSKIQKSPEVSHCCKYKNQTKWDVINQFKSTIISKVQRFDHCASWSKIVTISKLSQVLNFGSTLNARTGRFLG